MPNRKRLWYWILAAHLLLLIASKPSVAVPKTYGAFPLLLRAGGTIHVKKFVSGPRDGLSCDTGLQTIGDGMNKAIATGALIVEVCDSETYDESVGVGDGINLVSKNSALLLPGFTYQDVLLKCGETGPERFPTIAPGANRAGVAFDGLRKPASVSGFQITGGGPGVLVRGCRHVSIVGNCIDSNSSFKVDGGGISIFVSQLVEISRNAIHSNESKQANGVGGRGGGIAYISSDRIKSEGNLISANTAGVDGGGIYGESTISVDHKNESIFINTATEGHGGGAKYVGQSPNDTFGNVTFDGCEFTGNVGLRLGGGGIDFENVKSGDVRFCSFLSCRAGDQNPGPSIRETYNVDSGGGALRIHGGHVDILRCSIDTCTTNLDGGGVLFNSVQAFPVDTFPMNTSGMIDVLSSGTIVGTTIVGCSALDDGGGISNQVGSQLVATSVQLGPNNLTIAFGSGGGFHSSSSAISTLRSCTIRGNSSAQNGGGLYARCAEITIAKTDPATEVLSNFASKDGGGMQLESNEPTSISILGIKIEYGLDRFDAFGRLDGVSWSGNRSLGRAGALAVKRFDVAARSIVFQLEENFFVSNQGHDPSEAAVEIALSSPPPKPRARSFVKKSSFRNAGVQVKGIARVSPVADFYDIVKSTFFLDLPPAPNDPAPVGILLSKDLPTLSGNAFLGPLQGFQGLGISMQDPPAPNKKTFPQVEDCTFTNVALGLQVSNTGANLLPVEVRDSTFGGGNTGVEFLKVAGTVKKTQFSSLLTGLRIRGGTTLGLDKKVTFQNVQTPIDSLGN